MKGFPLLIVYQVHATGALNMSMASPMLFSNAAFLLLACNHFTSVRGHPTKVSVSDKGSQLTDWRQCGGLRVSRDVDIHGGMGRDSKAIDGLGVRSC